MLKALYGCIALAVLSIGTASTLTILDGRALLKAQFGVAQKEGEKTRDLLDRHARQIEQDARLRLDAVLLEVKALHATGDAQLTATRADVKAIAKMADRQLTGTRADLKTTVAASLVTLAAPLNGIRTDLQPVLVNAAALTKDAQDSWDDSYEDVRGLLQSAEVATTSGAQAMQAVRDAAPQLAEASVSVGKSAASIADSAAKEAKALTAPQSTREKVLMWLQLLPRLAIKLL